MNKAQQQVQEFMRDVKGLTLPTKPQEPIAQEIMLLCQSLMNEELSELLDAMASYNWNAGLDLTDICDGLADLLYVVYYTCNAYGIDIEPIFDEVHRSNMTKKGGPQREDGKQLKPPTYQPPNLEPLIREQMNVS